MIRSDAQDTPLIETQRDLITDSASSLERPNVGQINVDVLEKDVSFGNLRQDLQKSSRRKNKLVGASQLEISIHGSQINVSPSNSPSRTPTSSHRGSPTPSRSPSMKGDG